MTEPHRKFKILIVDDTAENIHILMEALKTDYAIVAATNGEKALRLALSDPSPDIILLDIMMPGIDGYEVCRRLKQDVRTKHVPVVFITALTDEEDEAKGLALGAVDFITKPFRPSLVKMRVHNHLELKNHRDHLEAMVRERTRELALTQEVTIEAMASLAETRDPETGGHIKRTQNYVRLLAQNLRQLPDYAPLLDSDKTIEMLYLSAPLHDIGKVGVPDAILLKPGKLAADEYEQMKKHTIYGRDAILIAQAKLGDSSFLHHAAEIAYTHHEKWDGTGYPNGLAGDAIPVSGRLMAIADVYDALISKRVYKPPFPHTKAVRIIAEGRGTHFDPAMVDAFLGIEGQFRLVALQFADHEEERMNLAAQ
ncbi:MAG: two-component system response regulator [Desulfovibrionaceae bacterium]